MNLSDLIKDKNFTIELFGETRYANVLREEDKHPKLRWYYNLFNKEIPTIKVKGQISYWWRGFTFIQNNKKIFVISNVDLVINNEKQKITEDVAESLYAEAEKLYEEQERRKRVIEAEAYQAKINQQKQSFYEKIQQNIK